MNLCKGHFNLVSKIWARGLKRGWWEDYLFNFSANPNAFVEIWHCVNLVIFRGKQMLGHSVLQTLALVFCVNWPPECFTVQNNSNSSSFVCSFHSNWWKKTTTKCMRNLQGLRNDFGKHLPQAWHNFNLPGNQYNTYLYVVRGEMLKQTSLTIYCAIIKNVKKIHILIQSVKIFYPYQQILLALRASNF